MSYLVKYASYYEHDFHALVAVNWSSAPWISINRLLQIWTCDNLAMVDELNAKRGPVLSMVVNGKLLYASHTDSR